MWEEIKTKKRRVFQAFVIQKIKRKYNSNKYWYKTKAAEKPRLSI